MSAAPVLDTLGPDGALARAVDGYEDRPGQRDMASAIAAALDDRRALIVEAGTGTGKTLAYLVPALLSGKRVVISTGTRTLQEQLLRNDLPLLRDIAPAPFEVAVLKGVSNYVCRRKLAVHGAVDQSDDFVRLRDWATASPSGDRADHAELSDDHPLWSEVTTTPEARVGPRCAHYERCFVTRARRAADKAALVIVNHHLFFSDLALRGDGARVLPDYDAVVFDEAHQLEDVLTEHFGVDVSTARIERFVRDARDALARDADLGGKLLRGESSGERIAAHVDQSARKLFAALRARLVDHAGGDRFALPAALFSGDAHDGWLALDSALDDLAIHTRLRAESCQDDHPDLADELASLAGRAHRIRDALATIADSGADQDHVFWGQLRPASITLRASPVSVDRVLPGALLPRAPAAIFTSATLTASGSFAHLRGRLGLDAEVADAIAVESPFDYASQCLLYVSRDLPDPRDSDATLAQCARIAELAAITDGRAFVLFTSHRALRACAAGLAAVCDRELLVQGQAPRAALIDRFRGSPGSLLLATGAFWEGVDVPGEALSQVIIDRLPFAVPTDPLVAARARRIEEAGGDSFAEYSVPQAALAFRQGFGRLIRRRTDRGIVSVLDPRLVTKRYGRAFTDSLPEVPRTGSLERVRRWWSQT